jgi:hypothetical protein
MNLSDSSFTLCFRDHGPRAVSAGGNGSPQAVAQEAPSTLSQRKR